MRRAVGVIVGLALWLGGAAIASAHPIVDEGRARFEEADFVAALDAFARAEAADDLSLEDLAALFALRAQVHLAMGNEAPMRADLARLAIVAPDQDLGRRVRPALRRAFAEERAQSGGALRLEAEAIASTSGISVTATVENDSTALVRQVRIRGRAAGADAWEAAHDGPLLLVAPGAVVEYYAQAIGPGGAVLASHGSAAAPQRYDAPASTPAGGGGAAAGEDLTGLAIGLSIGGVLAAALAITLAVILTQPADGPTEVQPFTVRF